MAETGYTRFTFWQQAPLGFSSAALVLSLMLVLPEWVCGLMKKLVVAWATRGAAVHQQQTA